MSKTFAWDHKDNTDPQHKIALRLKHLPENAHVLDCFCGTGQMHKGVYKGRAASYLGLDKNKVHDPDLCLLTDNIQYIQRHDVSSYDVFDLDDWGSPWKLMYLILRKHEGAKLTLFVTDGLVMYNKVNQTVSKFVSATEQVPKGMKIPLINRFYVDLFATMLLDIEKRYGWKTTEAVYFHNSRRSAYYWALSMGK